MTLYMDSLLFEKYLINETHLNFKLSSQDARVVIGPSEVCAISVAT